MSNTHAAIDLTEDEGSHMPKTDTAEEATDDAMVAAMSGMDRDMCCTQCGLPVSPGQDKLVYGLYEVQHRTCPALGSLLVTSANISEGMVPIRDENGDVRIGTREEHRKWSRGDLDLDSMSASSSCACANLDEQEARARDELSQMLNQMNKTFDYVDTVIAMAKKYPLNALQARALQELMYAEDIAHTSTYFCGNVLISKKASDGTPAQPFNYKAAASTVRIVMDELNEDARNMLTLIGKGKSKGKGMSTKQ